MTQAFNLSQLANNVNTSGLLNAAAGLYNQTPVANGGTGRSSVTSGRLIVGAGTSAMTELAGGATNDVVTWNGSAWVSSASQGSAQAPVMNVYVTPGTWTKPATIKGIKVTVVGGGGNSGAAVLAVPSPASCVASGGGGGGGAAIKIYPAPSLPGPQPYTVGTAASTSSFGVAPVTVISATGGSSSAQATASGPGQQISLVGGAGGTGSSGDANIGGTAGGWSLAQTATIGTSGQGGGSFMGGGGLNVRVTTPSTGTTGSNGKDYGGGAGGSVRTSTPAGVNHGTTPGATGATGVVIIEEFY